MGSPPISPDIAVLQLLNPVLPGARIHVKQTGHLPGPLISFHVLQKWGPHAASASVIERLLSPSLGLVLLLAWYFDDGRQKKAAVLCVFTCGWGVNVGPHREVCMCCVVWLVHAWETRDEPFFKKWKLKICKPQRWEEKVLFKGILGEILIGSDGLFYFLTPYFISKTTPMRYDLHVMNSAFVSSTLLDMVG